MIATTSSIRHLPVTEPKVRLFGADGAFLARITADKSAALVAANLAEWRCRDLHMVSVPAAPCERHSRYGHHFFQKVAGHEVSALRGVRGSR